MKNYMISIARLHVFVIAMLWLLVSCSKETEVKVEKDTAILSINVAGAKPIKDKLKLNASASEYGNMIGLEANEYISKKTSKQGRLGMDIITDQDVLGFDLNQYFDESGGLSKQADVIPVDGNVKYIFVFHKASDINLANALVYNYSVNDTRQLTDLETNTVYKWYAYSYLTEDNITMPVPTTSLLVPTVHNKTLVHASGEITITGGQNNLSIIFEHQLTQINVEVNVKRAYADITHIKGELIDRSTKVKTAMFDFTTGAMSSHTAAVIAETDLVFENKTAGDNSVKVAKYYTSDASLTDFSVIISELSVQYRNTATSVPLAVPNGGALSFTGFTSNNSGHVLQGKLNLTFTLPQVKIMAFSNNDESRGYRLAIGSGAGDFLRNTKWFGPNSEYVAIDGVSVDDPSLSVNDIYYASHSSTNQNKIATLLANPANYPEILIIANWYNYLNEASWNAVLRYLDAGGIVLHTQDENESNINGAKRADQFMSNLLGQPVSIVRGAQVGNNVYEMRGVYKFTDTPEALADNIIVKGIFGDVTPYNWGQDRYGTMYVVGYTGNDLIVYSNHAQNYTAQAVSGLAFFRHKTKKYFYVGDGGFYLNPSKGDNNTSYSSFPFRSEKTGANMDFPTITTFGEGAKSGSPMYNAPLSSGFATNYYRTNNRFQIANSMMFGNMMAWMMEQAYFNPVNKTGPIVNP